MPTCSRKACICVLGIQDVCHFTSRDMGNYPFYLEAILFRVFAYSNMSYCVQ